MNKKKLKINVIFILLFLFGIFSPAHAEMTELIGLLTSNLGVSQTQAEGGSGAIFDFVKKSVSTEDFSKITQALPGVESLISAAPKSSTSSGALGAVSSFLGSKSGSVEGITTLTDSFSKLGLGSEMVDKYMTIILDYTKSQAGEAVMNIIKGALP